MTEGERDAMQRQRRIAALSAHENYVVSGADLIRLRSLVAKMRLRSLSPEDNESGIGLIEDILSEAWVNG